MQIAVVDTETTDIENPGVVEFAAVVVDTEKRKTVGEFYSYVNPEDRPMNIKALATHHITQDLYESAPILTDVLKQAEPVLKKAELWCAHNAKFDGQFFPKQTFICTWRIARHIWPDAPGHSNQVLRYWLNLPGPTSDLPPHRALPDAQVTSQILFRILDNITIKECVSLSNKLVTLKTITFGKYEGRMYEEVVRKDPRYFRWVLNSNFNEDVKHTINLYL